METNSQKTVESVYAELKKLELELCAEEPMQLHYDLRQIYKAALESKAFEFWTPTQRVNYFNLVIKLPEYVLKIKQLVVAGIAVDNESNTQDHE